MLRNAALVCGVALGLRVGSLGYCRRGRIVADPADGLSGRPSFSHFR